MRGLKIFDTCVMVVTIITLLLVGIFTVPRIFSIVPFVVQSASMEPAIKTGSVVFVDKNDTDVEVGDVITFGLSTSSEGGVYVTHRVHAIDKDGLIQTKGDANDAPDGFLSPDAVVGTVIVDIPYVGFILYELQQHYGYMILFWIIVGLNLISIVWNYGQHAERLKNKKK